MRTATCHPEREHKAKGLCSACWKAAYRLQHADKLREQAAALRAKYPERHREYMRRYLLKHGAPRVRDRAEMTRRHAAWRAANIDRVRENDRELKRRRRAADPAACNEIKRAWWAANKDRVNAKRRAKSAAKKAPTK